MKPFAALLFCLAVLSACSYSGPNVRPYVSWTGLVALQKLQRDSGWAIDKNASMYLVAPMGMDDPMFAVELTEVFKRYYPHTRQSQFRESLNQAFVSARYAGMDYVVFPRIYTLEAQQSLGAFIRKEIPIEEFKMGAAQLDIYIFASQGEELVDHLRLDTRGSLFTTDSRELLWPPLDEYLRSVSQFSLARR